MILPTHLYILVRQTYRGPTYMDCFLSKEDAEKEMENLSSDYPGELDILKETFKHVPSTNYK